MLTNLYICHAKRLLSFKIFISMKDRSCFFGGNFAQRVYSADGLFLQCLHRVYAFMGPKKKQGARDLLSVPSTEDRRSE